MAVVSYLEPIAALRGDLRKKGGLYARVVHGRCIVQRKPRQSSEKQRAMRQAFGARYGGRHPP